MAEIRLEGLKHTYFSHPSQAQHWALKGVDHVWANGGAYALLGPSGCGKTTLLNIISGLVQPSHGRILFDRKDVTAVPTERRNIAQVFQFPVLYDTMTVRENLAFPLRNRGTAPAEAKRRVEEIASLLDLGPLLDRRASGLDAAQKQKISLGRGLVRADVAAILFDEPLTVIDPQVKFELRRKLKDIHEQLSPTLVYVTHDQNEALTFADKVMVMHGGEVVQFGTPEELYERPQHTFVGWFIGSPGMNLLPVEPDGGTLAFPGGRVPLPERLEVPRGAKLELGIRPAVVEIAAPGGMPADVVEVTRLGTYTIVELALGATRLKARLGPGEPVPERPAVRFPPERALLYADARLVGALR
jgi:glycerol transport system ATP-binding protein